MEGETNSESVNKLIDYASVDGKRYFDCPLKYGAFIKPTCVKVGDYPELSFSDDEM